MDSLLDVMPYKQSASLTLLYSSSVGFLIERLTIDSAIFDKAAISWPHPFNKLHYE